MLLEKLAPRFALLATLALSGAISAQAGPYAEGELLVLAPGTVLGRDAIYRIDPASGHGELFVDEVYFGVTPGWIAHEPVRNRLLAYMSYFPLQWNPARLYEIAADGTVRGLGFEGQKLSGLAPTGDGRVYMNKDGKPHLYTLDGQLLPLLDEAGVAIDLTLDHLAYDAATDSLIGVAAQEFDSVCFQGWSLQLHRMPLAASGTQLSSPMVCSSFSTANNVNWPIGLDPLPNGNFLIPLTGVPFSNGWVFLELDPATLGVSLWSSSTLSAIDGGVYTPILDKVVTIADAVGFGDDELRVFAKGQGGSGTPLHPDVPIDQNSSGNSTTNRMADVNLLGPACGGYVESFGSGLAGAGSLVPALHAAGCPRIGATLELEVWNAVGGSPGAVFASLGSTSIPVLGGTLYVLPPFALQASIANSGATGVPGAGAASVFLNIAPNPVLVGLPFYAQAFVFDNAAVNGVALSRGIELTLGPL